MSKTKYSQDLINTVKSHPHIETVYFDVSGNHYLNVHKYKDGSEYGRILEVKTDTGQRKGSEVIYRTTQSPVEDTLIIEKANRKDITS